MKLVEYSHTKGNIDYYIPTQDMYIQSVNLLTGEVEQKKILEYTIHKNLFMFKVFDSKNRFEPFWVSSDHSLIVYNHESDILEKQTPLEIQICPQKYSLIQYVNEKIRKIPCLEIHIVYDPNVTEAADFTVEDNFTFCTHDGVFVQDTLAVYTPISQEALEEVKKLTNILHSANPRRVILSFTKDVKSGVCLLTMDPMKSGKYKFWKKVKYGDEWTTEGRLYIWNSLPKEVQEKLSFSQVNKKLDINSFLSYLVSELNISQEDLIDFSYKVQKYALDAITLASESIDIKTFEITESIKPLTDELDKVKNPIDQQKILDKINKVIMSKLLDSDIKILLECGTFKKNQLFQLLGSKGLMLSPDGKVILVKSNFSTGLKPTEFFNASYGARNGIISRTNKTAISGYLSRKLVYGLSSVILDPNNEFCGTSKQLEITVTEDLASRIINRYAIVDNKLVLLDVKNVRDLIGKTISLYSPMYCKSRKLCVRCFGEDYKLIDSVYVGMIAAQTLGERLTQEMLKAFHTGGVVKPIIVDFYKNVSENTRLSEETLKRIFGKQNLSYYAKVNLILEFNKDDGYNLNMFQNMEEDYIPLPLLTCKCIVGDNEFSIVFDGNTNLFCPSSMEVDKKIYRLSYNINDKVFDVIPEVNDMELITKRILSTVEGRSYTKDEYHLLMKVYRELKPMGDINLNWIEILVSQLVRCKQNPSIPARLCETNEYQTVSIKNIPYLESWIRGLEFENFGKSITNALIHNQLESITPLDTLLI